MYNIQKIMYICHLLVCIYTDIYIDTDIYVCIYIYVCITEISATTREYVYEFRFVSYNLHK